MRKSLLTLAALAAIILPSSKAEAGVDVDIYLGGLLSPYCIMYPDVCNAEVYARPRYHGYGGYYGPRYYGHRYKHKHHGYKHRKRYHHGHRNNKWHRNRH